MSLDWLLTITIVTVLIKISSAAYFNEGLLASKDPCRREAPPSSSLLNPVSGCQKTYKHNPPLHWLPFCISFYLPKILDNQDYTPNFKLILDIQLDKDTRKQKVLLCDMS